MRLPGPEGARPCIGRVVDGEGQPIGGVEVHAEVLVTHTPEPLGWVSYNGFQDETVETDRNGVFRLPPFRPEGCRIVARHGELSGVTDANVAEPRIVIALPCEIEVRLGAPSEGRHLRVCDAEGDPLLFSWFQGGFEFMQRPECALSSDFDTLRLTVPQTARSLTVFDGDRQVSRVGVQPTLAGTTWVDL